MEKCLNMTALPIPMVRIGLIGLGNRGLATLKRYMVVKGARITVISDLRQPNLQQAISIMKEHGQEPPQTFCGDERWKHVCESDNVDLVYICTDWWSHAEMAVYAMQRGKHVALEVPAAMSVRECWQLVNCAEETQRHCVMLENCCYDTFHLGTMGLVRKGMLGTITHCEGAYIHDLRDHHPDSGQVTTYHKNWMRQATGEHHGNPYPTHGLGPACQILGIHRGDRMKYLVSSTGLNKINNTLITTELGRTILIQFDETTPRPYSRLQTVCGTRGFVQKYPRPTMMLNGQQPHYDQDAEAVIDRYCDAEMKKIIQDGYRLGVPNVMNYTMDCRLINALNQGLPLDMDVYDAAEWSCITELSELSATNGSMPVQIPDFTRGSWR